MSNIVVIVYTPIQANPVSVSWNYLWRPDPNPATAPQTDSANTHFIGRYRQPVHKILPALWQGIAADGSSQIPQPTNVNFIAKFRQPAFTIQPGLRQNRALDLPPATFDTASHFIGKFHPQTYDLLLNLWQNTAYPAPITPPVLVETNVHFVPKFFEPTFQILTAYFSAPATIASTPQPSEINANFIARHRPVSFTLLSALRQNQAIETLFVTQPETNIHFVPRYTPARFAVLPGLRQNIAVDLSSTPQAETNTNFIANFRPTIFNVLQSLRSNTANDTSSTVTQPETNTNFIAKFTGARFNLLATLRQNPAADLGIIPISETNVHFIPRYSVQKFKILTYLWQMPDAGESPAAPQVSTPINFIAKFSPYSYAILASLRQNVALDIPAVIPVIPAQYRLLVDHYLVTGYTGAGTIVTEGVQIPFGWIPTVAVDPLNSVAIQKYWNAGPTQLVEGERSRDFYPFATWFKPSVYWSQVPGTNNTFILTGAGASLGAKQSG